MKLADVVQQLDAIAPPQLAEAWDNVGLLVGDAAADVSRAILCIDYTASVAAESKAAKCDLVIAYHPPIFKALKRVTASGGSALVFDAARSGLAIYSPHTALDVADGGTNDVLADLLGLIDRRPLRASESKATECKLVTFVPADQIDRLASALFAAGAGRIGQYSSCSFRSEGVGTFLGENGARPAVGETGRLEKANEIRLETIVPLAHVGDVIAALKAAHPYETPAFDLLTLTAPPTGVGIGRFGQFATPISRAEFITRIRDSLGLTHVLAAGPLDGVARTVAICAGAGGDLLDSALAAKADVYLTGELRHHDALRAAAAGMTVICTLHSHSERVTLRHLAKRLLTAMPEVTWQLSAADIDPFTIH